MCARCVSPVLVYCLLFVVYCVVCVVVGCSLLVVCCLFFVICCLVFVVCCLVFGVRCVLLVVWFWMRVNCCVLFSHMQRVVRCSSVAVLLVARSLVLLRV